MNITMVSFNILPSLLPGGGGTPELDYYSCALPAMIADWRAKLQEPELAFGVILLAPFQSSDDPWYVCDKLWVYCCCDDIELGVTLI